MPNPTREEIARVEAVCRLIERRAPDGDDRVLFDASTADQHASDLRSILNLIKGEAETLPTGGDNG